MARRPRIVVPGVPHHVTQRGNRRQRTFFCAQDYHFYRATLIQMARRWKVAVWAYCLLPNHVHLILVPENAGGLTKAVGGVHHRYTRRLNRRQGWTGCLWQGRYFSFPMDETHLLSAVRYVLLNPVRAGLVRSAWDWPYSSARCHVLGEPDRVVDPGPLADRVSNWRSFLSLGLDTEELEELRLHQRTGRPLGTPDFVEHVESTCNRRGAPRLGDATADPASQAPQTKALSDE